MGYGLKERSITYVNSITNKNPLLEQSYTHYEVVLGISGQEFA